MPDRLKLAIVLEATAGGTRKHVRELALGLDPRVFDVHLVLSFARSDEMRVDLPALMRRGVHVHAVPMSRRIHPIDDGRALGALVRLFGRERFDVVHTQSSKAGVLGRLAASIVGVRRICHTPHVWPFQWTRPPAREAFLRIEKLASDWCDAIVCVGPTQREIGLAAGVAPASKLITIENGIAEPRPVEATLRQSVRAELGMLAGELAVGMVARLSPQKGVGRFIDAAAIVARANPEGRFFLIGSGPLERRMRRRARAHGLGPGGLAFLGHREDVARLYAGLDVFVLSSLYEGLPYVILEAMAGGLPVVATDVTGTGDVVDDGRTGLLVPMGDARLIASGIIEMLSSADLRRGMGEEGARQVKERFRIDRFIEAHARLYRTPG